jgi:HD domain.
MGFYITMDSINCVKKKIEGIIEKSAVPEDPIHAKNTWLLKLKPDADEALKIAALGHDIERAIEEQKVRRKDYISYDEFKKAHALNGAKILKEIMMKCNLRKELVNDVFFLVRHHEIGGDRRADVLRDSISFFHVPYYFARNGVEETKKRWGYEKLAKNLQVVKFNYEDDKLGPLVRTWVEDG